NQLAGTMKIAEMAKESGVRTLVGFQTRQAAYVKKVKEILESGLLGRIISTSLYLTDTSNGASMVDIDGGHLIDILDASDKPVGNPIPQDDIHQVVFGGQFGNKDATVLSVNLRHVRSEHGAGMFWVIDGEKGTIKMKAEKGPSFMRTQPELWVNGEKVEVEQDSEAERSARNWSKFADRAEGEFATIDDALKAKRVVDAIFRSSREGRRIDL
ncbi:hypothetical protein MPER_10845, partial [Moniliophthora perniciosa FA553]